MLSYTCRKSVAALTRSIRPASTPFVASTCCCLGRQGLQRLKHGPQGTFPSHFSCGCEVVRGCISRLEAPILDPGLKHWTPGRRINQRTRASKHCWHAWVVQGRLRLLGLGGRGREDAAKRPLPSRFMVAAV